MAIGKRRPVIFYNVAISEQEGGAYEETYVVALRTFAKITMRSSNTGFATGQRSLTTIYELDEIRAGNVVPDMKMKVEVVGTGLKLVIDSILDKGTNPAYYKITATENGPTV